MNGLQHTAEVGDSDTTLAGALAAAASGWKLLPVEPPVKGDKDSGKNPRAGFHWPTQATSTPRSVRGWFGPDGYGTNYGILAAANGLVILDGDAPGALDAWAADYAVQLPPTYTVATAQGEHRYYLAGTHEFTQGKPTPTVDVRFRGYVVGPGSVHWSGAVYTVTDDRAPVPLPTPVAHALHAAQHAAEAGARDGYEAPRAAYTPTETAWLRAAYRGALADLAAAADMPLGATDQFGKGWDGLVLRAFNRGVGVCNALPDEFPLERARAEMQRAAPRDSGFPDSHVRRKWNSAVSWVGDRALTPKVRDQGDPLDGFSDLGPAESAGAASPDQGLSGDQLAAVRARYPLKDLRALLHPDRPPRPWVVQDLLPAEASASLIAPAGLGKSLFALSLSVAVARGDAYFAGLQVPQRRRVLYVDWENGEYDYIERLASLGFTHENVDVLDGWFFPLELPDALPSLDTPEGRRELGAIIDAYELRRQDLVVLDSAQRMVGGPENDSDTWRAYYEYTALMLKARGLTVLRMDNIGHQDKSRSRGSSSKIDDVDAQWVITPTKNAGPGTFDFTPTKGRMRGDLEILTFERREVDGVLTWSTGRNPQQDQTAAARRWLDAQQVPPTHGGDRAWEHAKANGCPYPRGAVRAAQAQRKAAVDSFGEVPGE